MKDVPSVVLEACQRAASIRADPEMMDYSHSRLRLDVLTLMEFIESLPDGEADREAREDAFNFGNGYIQVFHNGVRRRIDPRKVVIQ